MVGTRGRKRICQTEIDLTKRHLGWAYDFAPVGTKKSCFVPAGALFSGQILTDMRTSMKQNAEKILLPFVHTRRISLGKSIQPHEREQSVQHQQLISETIAVDRSGPDI